MKGGSLGERAFPLPAWPSAKHHRILPEIKLTRPILAYIFCMQMTTKRIHNDPILGALITSQARIEILKLLMLNPADRRYLREVASLARVPVQSAQRELARLEKAGLLTATIEGNRKYYQANRQSPVFPEIKSILMKTVGLGDALRQHLPDKGHSIQVAFLFGSYAQGTEGATSDIDLLVVGTMTSKELAGLLRPVRDSLQREINSISMTPTEFRARARRADPFLAGVLREPKIFLVGGENDLGKLVEPGKA
jgi:predicted nucleotidyltransferase